MSPPSATRASKKLLKNVGVRLDEPKKKRRKRKMGKKQKRRKEKGITLVALVVTIIVLIILARSKYCDDNWSEWNSYASTKGKGGN